MDKSKVHIYTDGACSGNPGIMEYQGVFTETESMVFHLGPFPVATVNIGEFLALVHALAYLKKNKLTMPIYTDSRTAMSWVNRKQIKTNLPRNEKTEKLFQLVDRALFWLDDNHFTTQILK